MKALITSNQIKMPNPPNTDTAAILMATSMGSSFGSFHILPRFKTENGKTSNHPRRQHHSPYEQ
ncbi:hypothetical protein Q5762_38430, partial [Streptomyces sp. P9(2023)]|uniref:hypothetical protein n=1 Tax=Streptomyces sp. P9(2023) TaxID=3064394 RepID=UPI0028F4572C